jgi:hypothetical protein
LSSATLLSIFFLELLLLNFAVANSNTATDKILNDCDKWTSENSEGKKSLERIAKSSCHETAKSGTFSKSAYSLCKKIQNGTDDSEGSRVYSHQVYSFNHCLEKIKDEEFFKDSLEVVKKYQSKISFAGFKELLINAKGVKDVPSNKGYVSRLEVAKSCREWVSRNQGEKVKLGKIASESCIATAVSGNFTK